MRELKFRAWDKVNKTYTYVTLGDLICGACTETGDKKLSGNEQIWEQYTGLKDKNGNMIFNGDIVEHDVYHIGIKAYRSKSEVFISDLGARIREDKNDEECSLLRYCTNIEVVGNVHENPELLGEAK